MYFIAKDGSPLDIIKGNDDLTQISTRVESILSKAGIVTTSKIIFFSHTFLHNMICSFTKSSTH